MKNMPGESLFLLHTGHSMHVERPAFVAEEIVKFLPPRKARSNSDPSFLLRLLLSETEVPPPRHPDIWFLVSPLPSEDSVSAPGRHDLGFLLPLLLSGPG